MKKEKFGVIKLLLLVLVVSIIASIPTLAVAKYKKSGLGDELNQDPPEFEGVINVWNVDTFEGGSVNKSVYLDMVSQNFAKENKGVYFLIKNITPEELIESVMAGVLPDVVSFGYGLGNILKPYLLALDNGIAGAVRKEIISSGSVDGNILSVGYLVGSYILATSEEKVLKQNSATDYNNLSLLQNVNNLGFDKSSKKGTVHTSSVVVGKNRFVDPLTNFDKIGGVGLTDYYESESMYDAYLDFVAYNMGTILVGTHRDLFKLYGRVAGGKLANLKVEYLTNFTNLVQYIGVINSGVTTKMEIAKNFIQAVVSEKYQKLTEKVGMVNALKLTIESTTLSYYADYNRVVNSITNFANVFG